MKVIATGKWLKADKRWTMLVALRRQRDSASGRSHTQNEQRQGSRPRPPKSSGN